MLQFRITGRYTNGNSVPAYYLECTDFSQSGRYTREQVLVLAAQNKIVNCGISLTRDSVALHGKGCNLSDLPSKPDITASSTGVKQPVKQNVKVIPEDAIEYNGVIITGDIIKKIGNMKLHDSVCSFRINRRYNEVMFSCYGPDCEFFDAVLTFRDIYGVYCNIAR